MSNKQAKIKIQDFVKNYTLASSESIKEKMLDSVIRSKYASFGLKMTISKTMIHELSTNEDGLPRFSSPMLYLSFVMSTMLLYTSFELHKDRYIEDYDAMKASGVLEKIIEKIPDREFEEWQTVWQMTVDDEEKNAKCPAVFFASQVTRFGNLISGVCKPVLEEIRQAIQEHLTSEDFNNLKTALKELTEKTKQ